ncbi:hypothetical protein Tsubulata_033850 [Turnera subulata]|uniref:F-box domain-containing protein n=1 Tax=Turnera subulata TaxID=218843 RepID=A0A9Q0J1D6_9ROSI|nr:hypothetical protein Tsubulata_033850 [Turnera subulata]
MARSWSDLPIDLVEKICSCLQIQNNYFDILRFRAVCSSWRRSSPPLPPMIPTLSIPPVNPSRSLRHLYFVPDKSYQFELKELAVYSVQPARPSGTGTSTTLLLLTPSLKSADAMVFRGLNTSLPSKYRTTVFDLRDFVVNEMWFTYCLVPTDGSTPVDPRLVAVSSVIRNIGDGFKVMAFIEAQTLAVWMMGGEGWTINCYRIDWTHYFRSVSYGNGKLYALHWSNKIAVIDTTRPRGKEIMQVVQAKRDEHGDAVFQYLVESLRDVFRLCQYPGQEGFEVEKLDTEGKLVKLSGVEVEERLFFVGSYHSSFSVRANDFPEYKTNCIHFTSRNSKTFPHSYCHHCGSGNIPIFDGKDGRLRSWCGYYGCLQLPSCLAKIGTKREEKFHS